jgi:hypothetical protein
MIKCKECGYRISENASACPNCGEPHKTVFGSLIKFLFKLIKFVVILIVAFFLYAKYVNDSNLEQRIKENKEFIRTADTSLEKQEERRKYIDYLIVTGVFSRITDHSESDSPFHDIDVGNKFLSLSEKEQIAILNKVLIYYLIEDDHADKIRLYDASKIVTTYGHSIGAYSVKEGICWSKSYDC